MNEAAYFTCFVLALATALTKCAADAVLSSAVFKDESAPADTWIGPLDADLENNGQLKNPVPPNR